MNKKVNERVELSDLCFHIRLQKTIKIRFHLRLSQIFFRAGAFYSTGCSKDILYQSRVFLRSRDIKKMRRKKIPLPFPDSVLDYKPLFFFPKPLPSHFL